MCANWKEIIITENHTKQNLSNTDFNSNDGIIKLNVKKSLSLKWKKL